MTRHLATLWLAMLLAVPMPGAAGADIASDQIEWTGPTNADYADAVRGHRMQSEIVYLHPAADPQSKASSSIAVPRPTGSMRNWMIGGVAALLLFVVIVVLVRYGARIPLSFSATPSDRKERSASTNAKAVETALHQPLDGFLDTLRSMADRREALILLVRRALEHAAHATGLNLARAQTARDVVRALPKDWPHLATLRTLVGEAEMVHFGGRDLPEERFRSCLEAAAPILGLQPKTRS